jgi:leucyl-tRNA synthetase
MRAYVQCLAPLAPHIAEELWQILGGTGSVHHSTFPDFDPSKMVAQSVEVVVQISSKIRGKITVAPDADAATMESAARADENVAKHLEGKTVVKTIVVPGKLVNFIVK